jgi:hypothetical protein|tara:strand:+ start:608 stop:799 length:192 start_codon:yes stop_codon:yes gene_type:complete
MGKDFKKIKINGLSIEVKDQKLVLIKDRMSNCDEAEAVQICSYLVQEGFVKKENGIQCEIERF